MYLPEVAEGKAHCRASVVWQMGVSIDGGIHRWGESLPVMGDIENTRSIFSLQPTCLPVCCWRHLKCWGFFRS